MKFLTDIFNPQANCGAHLFATSRFILEITKVFKSSTSLEIMHLETMRRVQTRGDAQADEKLEVKKD